MDPTTTNNRTAKDETRIAALIFIDIRVGRFLGRDYFPRTYFHYIPSRCGFSFLGCAIYASSVTLSECWGLSLKSALWRSRPLSSVRFGLQLRAHQMSLIMRPETPYSVTLPFSKITTWV